MTVLRVSQDYCKMLKAHWPFRKGLAKISIKNKERKIKNICYECSREDMQSGILVIADVGDMSVASESLFEEEGKFLRSQALQLLLNCLMTTVSILRTVYCSANNFIAYNYYWYRRKSVKISWCSMTNVFIG